MLEGKQDAKVLPWNRKRKIYDPGVKDDFGQPILIAPSEVEDYLKDPVFQHYLQLWNISQILERAPFEGGWVYWPYDLLIAFLAFSQMRNAWREKQNSKNKPLDFDPLKGRPGE